MPSHSSHILQSLDLVCFALLKRAYGNKINDLARYNTKHIKKEGFLPASRKAFEKAFSSDDVQASLRVAVLAPHDPEVVLSKLDVVLRTPTPLTSDDTPWEFQNTKQRPRDRSSINTNSRSDSKAQELLTCFVIKAVDQFRQGAEKIVHEMVLMRKEIAELRKVAEAATERKSRKRKYVRTEKTLTVGEVLDLIASEAVGGDREGEKPARRARKERHWVLRRDWPQWAHPQSID